MGALVGTRHWIRRPGHRSARGTNVSPPRFSSRPFLSGTLSRPSTFPRSPPSRVLPFLREAAPLSPLRPFLGRFAIGGMGCFALDRLVGNVVSQPKAIETGGSDSFGCSGASAALAPQVARSPFSLLTPSFLRLCSVALARPSRASSTAGLFRASRCELFLDGAAASALATPRRRRRGCVPVSVLAPPLCVGFLRPPLPITLSARAALPLPRFLPPAAFLPHLSARRTHVPKSVLRALSRWWPRPAARPGRSPPELSQCTDSRTPPTRGSSRSATAFSEGYPGTLVRPPTRSCVQLVSLLFVSFFFVRLSSLCTSRLLRIQNAIVQPRTRGVGRVLQLPTPCLSLRALRPLHVSCRRRRVRFPAALRRTSTPLPLSIRGARRCFARFRSAVHARAVRRACRGDLVHPATSPFALLNPLSHIFLVQCAFARLLPCLRPPAPSPPPFRHGLSLGRADVRKARKSRMDQSVAKSLQRSGRRHASCEREEDERGRPRYAGRWCKPPRRAVELQVWSGRGWSEEAKIGDALRQGYGSGVAKRGAKTAGVAWRTCEIAER